MRYIIAVLLVFAIQSGHSARAGTVYKCKNPEGRLVYQEAPCAKEVESVSSWASKSAAYVEEDTSSQTGTLVLGQRQGGHYFVNGSVNSQFLNFVIDTGATKVSLPAGVANSAGIKCTGMAMTNTANGTAVVCTAIIQELKFGSFTVRNVEAVVLPNLSQPLLGMNVLSRFRVEQDGGQMRLSRRY